MSVTAIHLLFKEKFEPVVRVGENVKLLFSDAAVYGRVEFVEPVQPLIINLGVLPAASPSMWPAVGGEFKISDLELGESEFGQWRMMLLDDFLLEVRMPPAVRRFLRKKGATVVSRLSPPGMLEFYTYSDRVPTFVPLNPNFRQLEMARVAVAGFRYIIEELKAEPREYTVIPVDGRPTTVRG